MPEKVVARRDEIGADLSLIRSLVFLFLAALCLLPASGCHKRPGIVWELAPDGKQPKARSVAELAERYDSEHCGECHQEVYRQWKNSIHARPLIGTGRTVGSLGATITSGLMEWGYSGVTDFKDVRLEHLMTCAKCHLPQLAEATDDVAREIAGDLSRWADAKSEEDDGKLAEVEAKLSSLTIGCLVCHNRNAIVHKWTDGYPLPKTVYGSKGEGHFCGFYPKSAKSPVLGESIFCGQCHGQGPNFEFDNPTQCTTAYSSYLFSYRANGGKEECQDCHMRKQKQGHDMRSYTDPRMSSVALDFTMEAVFLMLGDGRNKTQGVAASVTMVNRAGHSIPDG